MAELSSSEEIGLVSQQFFLSDHPSATAYGTFRVRLQLPGAEATFRYRCAKRCLDLLLVVLALPILLPLVAAIALAVYISSPGPVFFSHRRVRNHENSFPMWKFRTMCVNAAEVLEAHLAANPAARAEWNRDHKLKQDPRVTSVGRFLRRTSLDELPQIWNVFRGSMSLVGPRPIVTAEVNRYGKHFCDYCRMKPGITGLWQVSGRSQLSYPERVQLDTRYARDWTFWGDIRILLRTLGTVFRQDGAY